MGTVSLEEWVTRADSAKVPIPDKNCAESWKAPYSPFTYLEYWLNSQQICSNCSLHTCWKLFQKCNNDWWCRQTITATFVETLDCKFLPVELIYGGKTSQWLPKIQLPTGFCLSSNPSHYSNTEESIKLLKK